MQNSFIKAEKKQILSTVNMLQYKYEAVQAHTQNSKCSYDNKKY